MCFVRLNLACAALLAFCTVSQTFSIDSVATQDPDAVCLIQWQMATEVTMESDRPKKGKEQKLENFNCGDHAWCSGLKNTVKKVTQLTKTAPTISPSEETLQPLVNKKEKVADLHKQDATQIKLNKAQNDLIATEKALTAVQDQTKQIEKEDKSGANGATVAKWKRFAKKLTREKEALKTTFDDLKAENQWMKENITRITRDKEQAQEVALVIANQWRNNARSLTSANKVLLGNITKLTAEKQQVLGELERATSDRQRVAMEKDEAAVEFQRSHESDHAILEQWRQYADRLTNEKQQLNDAIAKLASEKTNLESTITNFNQAMPNMSMEDGAQDVAEFAHRIGPVSSVVPISYAQQPRYEQDLYAQQPRYEQDLYPRE